MKKISSIVGLKRAFRTVRCMRMASAFLLCGLLILSARAQVGLPVAAISVPTDHSPTVGVQSAQGCDLPNKLIVLPAIHLQLDENSNADGRVTEEVQMIQKATQGENLWLYVVAAANSFTGKESEKQITEQVDRFLDALRLASPSLRGLIVEVSEPQSAPDLYAFELLRLAVNAKSSNSNLRFAFVFPPGFIGRHGDLVKRLALYADLLGTTESKGWKEDAAWIAQEALNKPLILKLESNAIATNRSYLSALLAASGSAVEILWAEPMDAHAADRVCALDSFMQHMIPNNMLPVNPSELPFELKIDGFRSEQSKWFGSGESSDRVVVADVNATPDHSMKITLTGNSAARYDVQGYDPETGTRLPAGELIKTEKGFVQTFTGTSKYLLISIHKVDDANPTVYNSVEVKGGVDLSVNEIIAHWQEYRETQSKNLENYISSSRMNLHFESTNVVSAFDISMQIKQFYDRSGTTELAQTALYVNGVKFNNKYEFPLPQLEPEKVLTEPLELKISEQYTYKLLGTEKVNGAACFVVGVEPKVQDANLYSGKIWIEGSTFREVKQSLSQRGNHSNVVVNIETQNYELVPDGKGNQFNLLRSMSVQQTLNAAGRDFLLQRTIEFSDYAINTPQFSSSLAAEHSSQDPMYRDTDQGLRALKKQGNARVLVEKSEKRISSIVGGAMYEGTFNFPIPIAGLSIADFDYRHTGAQLSTFFAGPILATDLSKQYGRKYRLSADLALSALPGEDRTYSGNTEETGEEVWSWAEDTGVRATWQATTHLSLTAVTYLEYDFYHGTSGTSSQYVVPRSGWDMLPGIQVRVTEKGYIFTADGTRGNRIGWRQFGYMPPTQPLESAFTLYDADLNKDYYFKKFTKGGWDLSYYGGNQLDRFSRYMPSFFSQPTMHGIPSGTDSFDAIAMGNVHYGFNLMETMKLEGMYSYARARNLDESSHFRKFDGLETRFNLPGPKGTLLQGTVSYALDGNIARYNSRWGVVFMIFKPLH